MNLRAYSYKQLKDEIERRERIAKEESVPEPKANPDFSTVVSLCQKYIEDIAVKGWVDEDYDNWIFEAAIQAVYGENVWEWVRKNTR